MDGALAAQCYPIYYFAPTPLWSHMGDLLEIEEFRFKWRNYIDVSHETS